MRCPNCGYCPHCGRSGSAYPSMPVPYPYNTQPYAIWQHSTTDKTPNDLLTKYEAFVNNDTLSNSPQGAGSITG
jgi:hypothetical protein